MMIYNLQVLWFCLFLFGVVSCSISIADMCRQRSISRMSYQAPWTLAVALLSIQCLLHAVLYAVNPVPLVNSPDHQVALLRAVLVAMWWGLIARFIVLCKRSRKDSS